MCAAAVSAWRHGWTASATAVPRARAAGGQETWTELSWGVGCTVIRSRKQILVVLGQTKAPDTVAAFAFMCDMLACCKVEGRITGGADVRGHEAGAERCSHAMP